MKENQQEFTMPELHLPEITDEDLSLEGINFDDVPLDTEYADSLGDTVPLPELPTGLKAPLSQAGDTVRIDAEELKTLTGETAATEEEVTVWAAKEEKDPLSPGWEPEFEQPISDYIPPQPIIFRPKSRLHELKRKLVAGPERRYYEISEQGFGKLQAAMFFSFLVVLLCGGSTLLYAAGRVPAERLKLMIFGQFLFLLLSALLGSYQLLEGLGALFKCRFTPNTMLALTFGICVADGVFCLQEQRVPCCAAFSLQVFMSLWGEYDRRSAEMGQMDTMRKAVRLHSLVRVKDYYDKTDGLLRSEGEVEDFMDDYKRPSAPEKALCWYCFLAMLVSAGSGIAAAVLHDSVSFGVQVAAVAMLGAVPVTTFLTLTRPFAILEKRLHTVGAVLCGWRGIKGLCRRAMFPLRHGDLFPAGSCRLNGVKFYGSRDPDQIIAYATAVICADGGGLSALFSQLLDSRSGRHYDAESLRTYGSGGLGGEVCGEPVLLGGSEFLKEMGVEIPEGIRVSQAVYVAIDGELCGLFALSYTRDKGANQGLHALCSYLGLRPVMITTDFMLTEAFLKDKFHARIRRMVFPERAVRAELSQIQPEKDQPGLALITSEGLAGFAGAVTGARALRSAWIWGLIVHMLSGIAALTMMVILAVLGQSELLTPANVLLYELLWIIPGLLITEWTRHI